MSHVIAISSFAMGDLSNQELEHPASGPDHPDHPGDAEVVAADDSPDHGRDSDPNCDQNSDRSSGQGYERDLGVIEAITYVTRSCPNGRVVAAARGALEAIKAGGPDSLKQQAYFVLAAIQGWRGDRAHQVHRSLSRYLDPNDS